MPESAQGQNKSYKAYIMGQGVDGVEKTPAWAEGITGIPADTIVELAREIGTAKPCAIYQGKVRSANRMASRRHAPSACCRFSRAT